MCDHMDACAQMCMCVCACVCMCVCVCVCEKREKENVYGMCKSVCGCGVFENECGISAMMGTS